MIDCAKTNLLKDLRSGFQIFLLALPLSLGIARASGYPPAMGILTAMIGGMVTSLFRVTPLAIKGPAAGLITVAAAAIADFGGIDSAWGTISAIVLLVGVAQILFGIFKLGSISEYFPETVVHGMLAAIGLIIILKHIPILLGVDPALYKNLSPVELFVSIPVFIENIQMQVAIIGFLSLGLLIIYPFITIKSIRRLPAPIWILTASIGLAIYWQMKTNALTYELVHIGNFWDSINIRPDFTAVKQGLFWKYFIMFLFVSTIESLLTVKALESIDPKKREVNPDGDLIGQGAGNMFSGLLGGLPMISEVVRSTSNASFGAQSKWANFFHGFFMLLVMLLFIPVIEWIPNASLAALLLFAGYNLASLKHFIHVYKIGKEQFVIFLVTIFFTLYEDLLVGVAAGMLIKAAIEMHYGLTFKNLFRAAYTLEKSATSLTIRMKEAAIFTHRNAIKNLLESNKEFPHLIIDLSAVKIIDHSFMVMLDSLKKNKYGDRLTIIGFENFRALSEHSLSTKVSTG
ncbi:SulP family inorganic anion transporter [Thermaurantimonas aggregans]|uniref:SulP family inorganic anion transporter n=1 Tax=Thermaurantimonas aggregans TaxID=2173829 RepID=UPI0023F58267|nr:SulP family inorganic anion transporter [Thermaurantimonas aggregans]MCX8147661.1 SulP family inorganic anion transporter [Thermaurantimonas aggregans]